MILIRTPVSGFRADELLPSISGDIRLKPVYVFCPGSAFEKGAEDWLKEHSPEYLTEAEAVALIKAGKRPRLIVSTSEKIDFSLYAPVPVVVLGHGLGLHKEVPEPDGIARRRSGVVEGRHLALGHVTMAVTHPDIEAQLLGICPEAAGHVVITGDTSYDLIAASALHRADYRAALGVEDHHVLVVLSVTWGEGSLWCEWPDVVTDFLASLPSCRYRVALMMHPHQWTKRTRKGIKTAVEPHRSGAGLILVPPDQWHSLAVAADAFVGDASSPTLYAAMADVPVAFGAYGDGIVAKDTVMAEAKYLIPHIDRDRDLRRQIDNLIAGHDPSLAETLRERLIARPGEALEGLRRLFYAKMGLSPPKLAVPRNAAIHPAVLIFPVRSHRDLSVVDGTTITLVRLPDSVCAPPSSPDEPQRHLVVEWGESDLNKLTDAAVMVDNDVLDGAALEQRLALRLEQLPGLRMTAVGSSGGCEILFRTRDSPGQRFSVKVAKKLLPLSALASAVYSLWNKFKAFVVGEFVVRMGALEASMSVTRAAL